MKIKYIIIVLAVIGLHLAFSYHPKVKEDAYTRELRVMLDNCTESVYTDNDCKNIQTVLLRYTKGVK